MCANPLEHGGLSLGRQLNQALLLKPLAQPPEGGAARDAVTDVKAPVQEQGGGGRW